MVVHRLLSVLLGMSAFGGAVLAQIESTGFEAEDGWVAGYSICGPEFAATCFYPVTDACVPNDHAASQNCCEGDPNVNTGWYMADDSRHCNEPHIDTANPFSGLQHLRFQRDEAAGNPPGCVCGPACIPQCSNSVLTPRLAPLIPDRTVISFEIAGSGSISSGVVFHTAADDDPLGYLRDIRVGFSAGGHLFIPDRCGGVGVSAPLVPDGIYGNITIVSDPGGNSLRYCYDGNMVFDTKFGPTQIRTVQGMTFFSYNGSGVWDIDDFSVTRGASGPFIACREFPSECQTTCGPRPCAALKAVAVNGEPITPTADVHVRPGDLIECEIHFSGWGGNMPEVQGFQADLSLRERTTTGELGTVLPPGWYAPPDSGVCRSAADCPPAYPTCDPFYGICFGSKNDREVGAFIDVGRPDYLLSGNQDAWGVDVTNFYRYRYFGVGSGSYDTDVPRYAGSLFLVVSEDACGTFAFRFLVEESEDTFIFDTSFPPVTQEFASHGLVVHVCEDDGIFCNGVDSCDAINGCRVTPPPDCDDENDCTLDSCNEATRSCDHVAVCGACCDQWNGDCQDAASQTDCNCPNCVWTGGADCADVECKAEFVAIPTVSEWGLVVLTLLLLTGGKVLFGVRSTPFPSLPGRFMATPGRDPL